MLYNFVSVWKANIFYIKHALSEMIDHDAFDAIIEIHEALNCLGQGKYYFEVESGRYTYYTQNVQVKDGKLNIHVSFHICAAFPDFKLWWNWGCDLASNI